MRKIALAATVSALAFAGTAQAGSFYAGISAGHDFGNVEGADTTLGGGNPAAYDYNTQGSTLGVLAGFNHTHDNLVFGLEADINWTDGDGDQDTLAIFLYNHQTEINWTGAVRARLGVIHGNNTIFVAGGYAAAGVDTEFGFAGSAPFHTYSETRTGWTLGAGLDHAFDASFSGRIEYRYSNYGETSNADVPDNSLDTNELMTHSIRGALIMNY